MREPFISLDCEANGLHGQIFAVAATYHVNGSEADTFLARCPIVGKVDPWVAENVLPAIEDVPETHDDTAGLVDAWLRIYAAWGGRTDAGRRPRVVTHIPWPIEARFLWDAHGPLPFSGPYPLIDVASMLLTQGWDPTSVDGYLNGRGLDKPLGSPHHPLHDARAAGIAYRNLSTLWELNRP